MSKKLLQLKKEFDELGLVKKKTDDQVKRLEALVQEINDLQATEGVMVEIARSFSFKLNVGNYESRDFFCSQKAECEWNDAVDISEALYLFCKESVLRDVNNYKAELDKIRNAKARKIEVKEDALNTAEVDVESEVEEIN